MKSKFIFMNETLTDSISITHSSAESESLIQVHSGQTTEGGEIQWMFAVLIVGMSGPSPLRQRPVHFCVMPLLQQYKSNREEKN